MSGWPTGKSNQTVTGADEFDEAIKKYYQDNAKIVQELLSLAKATAYNPLECAKA